MLYLICFLIGGLLIWLLNRDKEHTSVARSVSDLLFYDIELEDSIISQKDGSLLVSYKYIGKDSSILTQEISEIISKQVNDVLKNYSDSWAFHINLIRKTFKEYLGTSKYQNEVAKNIDEERNRYFTEGNHYVNNLYISLTWLPPKKIVSKFINILENDNVEEIDIKKSILESFYKELEDFEDKLGSIFKIQRCSPQETYQLLNICVNNHHHKIRKLPIGAYLSNEIALQNLVTGLSPKIGDEYFKVININSYPNESYEGITDKLNELNFPYRLSHRIIFLDKNEAEVYIERQRRQWNRKRVGFRTNTLNSAANTTINQDFIDLSASEYTSDANKALSILNSEEAGFCFYNMSLIIHDTNKQRLKEKSRIAANEIRSCGFGAGIEDVYTVDAWLGSLPGNARDNLKRDLISTQNISDIIPTKQKFIGTDKHPSQLFKNDSSALLVAEQKGMSPIYINTYKKDVGHTLIIGPTGSGKSVLINLLASQFGRYEDSRVIIFDYGHTALLTTISHNGIHYSIDRDGKSLDFQPLSFISPDDEVEIAWAIDWVILLLKISGINPSPEQINEITGNIKTMCEGPQSMKTLTHLTHLTNDTSIRNTLEIFTSGEKGVYGKILDGDKDSINLASITTFEMEGLYRLDDKIITPTLAYIFHMIEKSLDPGKPTMIIIEEAWSALKDPKFAEILDEWLLTLRKKNASVVLVAHSLDQILNLSNQERILNSIACKFFLPDPNTKNEFSAEKLRGIGVPNEVITMIAEAVPKKHYIYNIGDSFNLIDLKMSETMLAFLSPPKNWRPEIIRKEIDKLKNEHGEKWTRYWLKEIGLNKKEINNRKVQVI